MCALYRTWGGIGALVGANIGAKILGLDIGKNFVFGNHIGEAVAIIFLIGLLTDLNLFNHKIKYNYILLAMFAFGFGAIWEILSFTALFSGGKFILDEWFIVAPAIIIGIGMPVLYISDRISRERKIFGFDTTGRNGLLVNAIVCMVYSAIALVVLVNFGILHDGELFAIIK